MAHVDANYVVLEAGDADALREKVTHFIEDNWLPQGGVAIVNLGDGNFLYAQAMTFQVQGDDE